MKCKDFIIKGENLLRSNISFAEAEKATFEEDILFNSFFLSFDNGWIYFNLIQIQFENVSLLLSRCYMSKENIK